MSSAAKSDIKLPVLIAGAGMGGVVFAQALKKIGVPYLIFERDESQAWRGQGWGLTLHQFSTSKFLSLLPNSIAASLPSALVDPVNAANQKRMIYVNMATGEPMVKMDVPSRQRLNRVLMRQLMLDGDGGIDVKWGKKLVSYAPTEGGIKAKFADGTEVKGALLVGIDGVHSTVRAALCPNNAKPEPLPIHLLAFGLDFTKEQIAPLLEVDPVMILGPNPQSGVCVFYAVLSTPEVNGSAALPPSQQRWHVQLALSWMKGEENDGVPATNEGRLKQLHQKLAGVWEPLRNAVEKSITDKTVVDTLTIADWMTPEEAWDNLDGRVTIAGDAAHTMTMFRGEGFNNMVLDLYNLVQAIHEIYASSEDAAKQKKLIDAYEAELRERGPKAVQASRQQCLLVHDWERFDKWTKESKWVSPHEKK